MKHPRGKWGRQSTLAQLVFFAVRMALNEPRHPDYKRQRSTKRRDLAIWNARHAKPFNTSL